MDKIKEINIPLKKLSKYYMRLYFKFIKLLESFEETNKIIDKSECLNLANNFLEIYNYSLNNNIQCIDREKILLYVAVIYHLLGYKSECDLVLDVYDINYIDSEYFNIIINLLKGEYNVNIKNDGDLSLIIEDFYEKELMCERIMV